MKQIYLLILSSLVFIAASAADKTFKTSGSNWSDASSWDPIGVPGSGDVIYIPKGITLSVKNENLSQSNIKLKVFGEVVLTGNLKLGIGSSVELMSTQAKFVVADKSATLAVNNEVIIDGMEIINSSTPTVTYTGPAIANATTVNEGFSSTIDQILPVKFLSFSVTKASTGISVQWATAQEINADVFEVERSEDSRTWKKVGTVKAAGNSNTVQNYSFIDKTTLNGAAYYRIKQLDSDGKSEYTDVKHVANQTGTANNANNVNIYAAGSNVIVNFSKQVAGTVVVRLISFGGQVLSQQAYSQASQQIVFNRTSVNKGNYIISVTNNSDLNISRQVAL